MLPRISKTVIAALFAFFLLKIFAVVTASPVIGYANSWDFAREEACFGIWPKYPDGRSKMDANPAGPTNVLIRDGETNGFLCLPSADNVFGHLIGYVRPIGTHVDLRVFGLMRAAVLILSVGVLLTCTVRVRNRAIIAISLLGIFGDITYLGFFNTLYSDTSVQIGAYLSAMGVFLFSSRYERLSVRLVSVSLIGLFLLGATKLQYAPLAFLAGLLFAGIALFVKRSLRVAVVFLVAAIAVPLTFSMAVINAPVSSDMRRANAIDTFMGAVLPSASDPRAAMGKIGLPEHCAHLLGKTFYDPGVAQDGTCPEILKVSRGALLLLFVSDPNTLLQPVVAATKKLYLGMAYSDTENPDGKTGRRYRLVTLTSVSTALKGLSEFAFQMLFVISAALAACAPFLFRDRESVVLLVVGGGISIYAVLSSVFGDGLFDIQKHAALFLLGFVIQWSVLLCGFIAFAWRRREEAIEQRSVSNG
ncbi:hypothetical protein [Pseudomonas sp.]|uniref:glycan biosynthesis hexose transferase WsfD n=1 Tax=Pseudomonas sp. TaxID=306 RepID=UPI0031D301E4